MSLQGSLYQEFTVYIYFFSFHPPKHIFYSYDRHQQPSWKHFCSRICRILNNEKSHYIDSCNPIEVTGDFVNLRLATGDDDSDWGNEEDDEFDRKKCL